MVAKLRVPSDYGQWRAMAGLVLIAVLMSWMSAADAQDATAPTGDASVVDIVPNEGNPCTIGWFKLHGWLMWGAFAVCFPFGVFVARFGQNYLSQWLNAHIFFQVLHFDVSRCPHANRSNVHVSRRSDVKFDQCCTLCRFPGWSLPQLDSPLPLLNSQLPFGTTLM